MCPSGSLHSLSSVCSGTIKPYANPNPNVWNEAIAVWDWLWADRAGTRLVVSQLDQAKSQILAWMLALLTSCDKLKPV